MYKCDTCGKVDTGAARKNSFRHPAGWQKDREGRWRCPRHIKKTLATLGELIAARENRS